MKRSYLRACFLLFLISFLLLASCAQEPPFPVVSGKEALDAAEPGFGRYVYEPHGMDEVLVHRRTYEVEAGGRSTERVVDLYYPPGFRFRRPEKTVIGGSGRANWIANVSWAEMIAASGFVAIVIEAMPNEQDLYDQILERLWEDGGELYIDTDRYAFWAEGHGTPLPLTAAFRATLPTPPRGMVCVSPVMQIGEKPFEFKTEAVTARFPVLVAVGEEDGFYEVRRSVELFNKFADEHGIAVTQLVCPGGNHNWMTTDDYSDGYRPDPQIVAIIRKEIAFLKEEL